MNRHRKTIASLLLACTLVQPALAARDTSGAGRAAATDREAP